MPLITPNLRDVQDLAPLNAGIYPAAINAADVGTSQKGNNKVVVEFAVETANGTRKRTEHLVTDGKGAFKFDNLLRAVHMESIADRMRAGEQVPFDTDTLVGQRLRVAIVEEIDDQTKEKSDKIGKFLRSI